MAVTITDPGGGSITVTPGGGVVTIAGSRLNIVVNPSQGSTPKYTTVVGTPKITETLWASVTLTFNGGDSAPTRQDSVRVFGAATSNHAGQWVITSTNRISDGPPPVGIPPHTGWTMRWSPVVGDPPMENISLDSWIEFPPATSNVLQFFITTLQGGSQYLPPSGMSVHVDFYYS